MAIVSSVVQMIGNTPVLRVSKAAKALGAPDILYAKLEMTNPTLSAKDRAAFFMISDYERRGLLLPGGTIIEPTSGNTGIGLAAIGAARGYNVIVVMPDTMSKERIMLMTAYGASVVLTPGKLGMKGAIEKAEEIRANTPGAIICGQFENPANVKAHYETTGPEIHRDFNGRIGAFVAGIGTGGTITGCAKYLKEQNKDIEIIGVEPFASPLLTGGISGAHGLQGIGANFVPDILDRALIDRVLTVKDEDAFETARLLARTEGILAGITSGAALFAASQIAKERAGGLPVVCVLPDSGTRYLSGGLFE
ncbi:MAG: cysteine synthase A [Clostridia bacterium]|nr:cysteine synthase A [Clostridia bacterium]